MRTPAAGRIAMGGVVLVTLLVTADPSFGRGGGGRGGGGGIRGGGASSIGRSSSGFSRSGSSFNRPSGGMTRPSGGYTRPSGGATRPGGGGGGVQRPSGGGQRPSQLPSGGRGPGGDRIQGGDRNRVNTGDVNFNRNTNIGGDFDGWGGWDDHAHHPIAGGIAVGAAAAWTAAAIGSAYYTLPPGCPPYYWSGYTYYSCGGAYYEPRYEGTSVVYVTVPDPSGGTQPPPPEAGQPPPAPPP